MLKKQIRTNEEILKDTDHLNLLVCRLSRFLCKNIRLCTVVLAKYNIFLRNGLTPRFQHFWFCWVL